MICLNWYRNDIRPKDRDALPSGAADAAVQDPVGPCRASRLRERLRSGVAVKIVKLAPIPNIVQFGIDRIDHRSELRSPSSRFLTSSHGLSVMIGDLANRNLF